MSSELLKDFMDRYIEYNDFSQLQLKILLEYPNSIPVGGQFSILVLSYLCSVAL